jgi:hypothetical protein
MNGENVTSAPEDEKSTGKDRSTIEFPYADLDTSFDVVRGIHNAGGSSCESEQLAAQLKLEAKGGGFRLKINAARIFGLITYERGGRISLSRQAIDPQYERAAKVKAFLTVPLFQKVYDEFKGRPLPPRAALERTLVNFGVAEKVKDRARQILDRSAKQAAFFEAASDRLVKPRVDDQYENGFDSDQQSEQSERTKNGGGDGGGGGRGRDLELHPFIEGLLKTLPAPDTLWTMTGRLKWLQAANNIFGLIYTVDESSETSGEFIEITKKSP